MVRRIFFDTNVCGLISSSTNREAILRAIRSQFKIYASIHTLMELLVGIADSKPGYFERDQERIRTALGTNSTKTARILDGPMACALQHGAGIKTPDTGKQKDKYSRTIKIVLTATSIDELLDGNVTLPLSNRGWKVCLNNIAQDLEKGKSSYSGMLNEAKSEKLYFDDPQRWAIMMCLRPDVTLTDTQAARMQTALDAVYQYQQTVWCMSLNGSFKPEKHQNDWIDMNQLFHLADPAMRFLTADERIKQRCAKSDQARRILILNDFLANNCLAL